MLTGVEPAEPVIITGRIAWADPGLICRENARQNGRSDTIAALSDGHCGFALQGTTASTLTVKVDLAMTSRIRALPSVTRLAFALAGALTVFGAAHAQSYPNKTVTINCIHAAGTTGDMLARGISNALSTRLKQTFVVINRVGAGGYVGGDFVSRSAPDGYTLMFGGDSVLHNNLFEKDQTQLIRELTPVGAVAETPFLLIGTAKLPAKTLPEFIALIRPSPGKYNLGVTLNNTVHLDALNFMRSAGLKMEQIPYESNKSPIALRNNEAQLMFGSWGGAYRPLIESGDLLALAVSGPQRMAALPKVPTLKEQGVDVVFAVRFGLFAPARTPREVLTLLNREVRAATTQPGEMKDLLARSGMDAVDESVDAQATALKNQNALYMRIGQEIGVTPK